MYALIACEADLACNCAETSALSSCGRCLSASEIMSSTARLAAFNAAQAGVIPRAASALRALNSGLEILSPHVLATGSPTGAPTAAPVSLPLRNAASAADADSPMGLSLLVALLV